MNLLPCNRRFIYIYIRLNYQLKAQINILFFMMLPKISKIFEPFFYFILLFKQNILYKYDLYIMLIITHTYTYIFV